MLQKEFNNLTFLEKNIKLIDETENSKDFKANSNWQKIYDGLRASTATQDNGFRIKFALFIRGFSKTSVFEKATLDLNEKAGFILLFQN